MPACSIQNACLRYTNCLWITFFAAPERGKKQSFLRKFCLYWAAYHGSISVKWPRRLLACSRSNGFNPYKNRKCRIYSVFEVLLYTKCLWISLLISLWITFLLSWKAAWNSFFAMSPYLENGKYDFDLLDIMHIMCILSLQESKMPYLQRLLNVSIYKMPVFRVLYTLYAHSQNFSISWYSRLFSFVPS